MHVFEKKSILHIHIYMTISNEYMQYLACIWTHWDWKNQDRSQLSETVFIGYECSLSNKVFLGLYSEWSWKGGQIGVIQSW